MLVLNLITEIFFFSQKYPMTYISNVGDSDLMLSPSEFLFEFNPRNQFLLFEVKFVKLDDNDLTKI